MATGTPWNAKLRGVTVYVNGVQVDGSGRVSGLDFPDSVASYDPDTNVVTIELGAGGAGTLIAEQPTLPTNVSASGPATALGEVEFGESLTGATFIVDGWCEIENSDEDDPISVSGIWLYNGGSLSTTGPIEVPANGRAVLTFRATMTLVEDDPSPEFAAGVTATAAGLNVVACTVSATRAAVGA